MRLTFQAQVDSVILFDSNFISDEIFYTPVPISRL